MVWIRSHTRRSVDVRVGVEQLREFLLDIVGCGRLMPGLRSLEEVGDGVYHYGLEPFSNGAVSLTPDYQARFDTRQPDDICWEPHGESNFRSWGSFRTSAGRVPGETVLEIEVRSEASVEISPVVVPLVEPFAQQSSEDVTDGFLRAIADAAEGRRVDRPVPAGQGSK